MAKALQIAVRNFIEYMDRHEKPACFSTEKEYTEWLALERECRTQPIRGFVCRDCTPSHQARMVKEGRCFNSTVDITKVSD
jgi:hypothetical protein